MISRSWCFTLNNYTEAEFIHLDREYEWRYIIFGLEVGENGTPHLQGYVEFNKPVRRERTKIIMGSDRLHLEPRHGTRDEARKYCIEDGLWFEHGDWSAGGQGTRNDLKQLMTNIKSGMKKIDLMESDPNTYSKHMRFVDAYKAEVEKRETREFRHLNVEVHWGESGAGKTTKAMEHNDIFVVTPNTAFPFDGYDGETAILIDDFYGDMRYSEVLRILDGHQYRVNVKGSHRYARWTKVFITSNKSPDEWYSFGMTPALKRRLHTVTEYRNEVGGNTEAPTLIDMDI